MKDQLPAPQPQRIPHADSTAGTRHDSPGENTSRTEQAPWAAPSWLPPRLSALWQAATRHPPSRRTLILAAVAVGALAFIFGIRSPTPRAPAPTAPDTRLFAVTGRPTLVFEHFIGNVNVMPGPDGQVSIKQNENGETDEIQMHYAQRGDTITVTVDIPGGLMQDTWVDFDVTVPSHAGFTAALATGTLEATDLSGRIALSNTNGAIWATNLTGTIGLKTQSGSINLKNVTGQVAISTGNGTITTIATHLQGRSSIQAESGTINFHGTLSRTGSYVFHNGNGAVGLTLPASSAFLLVARTAGGSINSDFRGIATVQENGVNQAHGTVGAASAAAGAHLTIQTAGGSIDLHQGS